MSTSGIRQMIERRAGRAGVQGVHSHRFRRTFADGFLESGGNLDGRMAERAHVAHERLSPGDRI